MPGFEIINSVVAKSKSKAACRQSGGISLMFKSKFMNYVTTVKNTKNFLWSKISKEILKNDTDLYICGTYIPPEKSKYFDEEIFEEFENDVIRFSSRGNVITLGDFNARTNKLDDFVSSEGSDLIHDTSENSLHPTERQNFDSTVNNNGKKLIEICKNCDLRILNGRTMGDSLGRPTFHGQNGTSVVDYIICNQNLVQNIKHLIVKAPCYLSDHSQIITWIDTHETRSPENNTEAHFQPQLEKLPSQYTWTDISKDNFVKELKSTKILQNFSILIFQTTKKVLTNA
jgi:exonuclease III